MHTDFYTPEKSDNKITIFGIRWTTSRLYGCLTAFMYYISSLMIAPSLGISELESIQFKTLALSLLSRQISDVFLYSLLE